MLPLNEESQGSELEKEKNKKVSAATTEVFKGFRDPQETLKEAKKSLDAMKMAQQQIMDSANENRVSGTRLGQDAKTMELVEHFFVDFRGDLLGAEEQKRVPRTYGQVHAFVSRAEYRLQQQEEAIKKGNPAEPTAGRRKVGFEENSTVYLADKDNPKAAPLGAYFQSTTGLEKDSRRVDRVDRAQVWINTLGQSRFLAEEAKKQLELQKLSRADPAQDKKTEVEAPLTAGESKLTEKTLWVRLAEAIRSFLSLLFSSSSSRPKPTFPEPVSSSDGNASPIQSAFEKAVLDDLMKLVGDCSKLDQREFKKVVSVFAEEMRSLISSSNPEELKAYREHLIRCISQASERYENTPPGPVNPHSAGGSHWSLFFALFKKKVFLERLLGTLSAFKCLESTLKEG